MDSMAGVKFTPISFAIEDTKVVTFRSKID